MFKKVIVVISVISILCCVLILPASAGVQGDFGGDANHWLPFNIIYANSFAEGWPLYEFGVLSTVYNNSYGIQRRDTNFGSEDYRNALAQFVIYRPWNSWSWILNEPIIFDSAINYDSLWPELRTESVRAYTADNLPATERGGYLDCRWSGRVVFKDGTTSDSLEDVFFSGYFTRTLSWNSSGFLQASVTQASYDIDETLDYFNTAYADRGGVWYIDNISFSCVPMIYTQPDTDETVSVILTSSSDSSSVVGYSFVRPLSASYRSALRAFDSPIVQYETVSSWFDWIAKALSGFFNTPLAFIYDVPLTIGLLFFSVVAVFGLFFVFRAFAGG